jgi:hypothetical protein
MPAIHAIGRRRQGDDEHLTERIWKTREEGRAGGDADVSEARWPSALKRQVLPEAVH